MGMDLIVDILLVVAAVYLAIGVIFGPWFVFRTLGRCDPGLASVSAWLRAFLLPAAVGLWPILTVVLLRRRGSPQTGTAAREPELQSRLHRTAWLLILPVSLALVIAGWAISADPNLVAANLNNTGKAATP